MATRTIREGNVTTQILDLTNGIGGKSAEVSDLANKKRRHRFSPIVSSYLLITSQSSIFRIIMIKHLAKKNEKYILSFSIYQAIYAHEDQWGRCRMGIPRPISLAEAT